MSDPIEASLCRELHLFAMYRVLEAGILVFLAFSPLAGVISAPDRPELARVAAASYIALALLLLWFASRTRGLTLRRQARSEEHTSELQSLMRISYAVFCLKKKRTKQHNKIPPTQNAINT